MNVTLACKVVATDESNNCLYSQKKTYFKIIFSFSSPISQRDHKHRSQSDDQTVRDEMRGENRRRSSNHKVSDLVLQNWVVKTIL